MYVMGKKTSAVPFFLVFLSRCWTVENAADANWRSGGIRQKTQKRVWCQPRCQWQPLLSVCSAFCFPWHLSNTKWRSGFDGNELAIAKFYPPKNSKVLRTAGMCSKRVDSFGAQSRWRKNFAEKRRIWCLNERIEENFSHKIDFWPYSQINFIN